MSEHNEKEGKKIITSKVLIQNPRGKFLAIKNSEDREKIRRKMGATRWKTQVRGKPV